MAVECPSCHRIIDAVGETVCPFCSAPTAVVTCDHAPAPETHVAADSRADSDQTLWHRKDSGAFDAAQAPVIPGYEILGVLGRGGMGVVLKARHLALNRLVAIAAGRNGV